MNDQKSAEKTRVTEQDVEALEKILMDLRDFASGFAPGIGFTLHADPGGYVHMQAIEVERSTYNKYCHLYLSRKPFGPWEDGSDSYNAYAKQIGEYLEGREQEQKTTQR